MPPKQNNSRTQRTKETNQKKMKDAWHDKANCKGAPSAIFFPEIPNGDVRDFYWQPARNYCATCPVIQQCLAFCLPFEAATGRRDGFWAGMTPKQRDQHVRQPTQVSWKR
jgi:hypothetical protein